MSDNCYLYARVTIREQGTDLVELPVSIRIVKCGTVVKVAWEPLPINTCKLQRGDRVELKELSNSHYRIIDGWRQDLQEQKDDIFFVSVKLTHESNFSAADHENSLQAASRSILSDNDTVSNIIENNGFSALYAGLSGDFNVSERKIEDVMKTQAKETVQSSKSLLAEKASHREKAISYLLLSQKKYALDELLEERRDLNEVLAKITDDDFEQSQLQETLESNMKLYDYIDSLTLP